MSIRGKMVVSPCSEELLSHPDTPLREHLKQVACLSRSICEQAGLDDVLTEVSVVIGALHDIAKASPEFQRYIRGVARTHVPHALPSAAMACALLSYVWEFERRSERCRWLLLAPLIIRNHHSVYAGIETYLSMDRRADDIMKLNRWLSSSGELIAKRSFDEMCSAVEHALYSAGMPLMCGQMSFEVLYEWLTGKVSTEELFGRWHQLLLFSLPRGAKAYTTVNLLAGILADADIRSASGTGLQRRRTFDGRIVDEYVSLLQNESEVSQMRTELYRTVTQNIEKVSLSRHLFSITAPTGSGKTLAGLSAAFKLRERIHREKGVLPRVIYALPFLSITEQTVQVVKRVFEHAGLPPHEHVIESHSRAVADDDDTEFYTRADTWDAEVVVTTTVRLFDTLFTNRRSDMRRLPRLASSIVIMDEPQTVPPKYWRAFEEAFKALSNYDCYLILMTATMPRMFQNAYELAKPCNRQLFNMLNRTRLHIRVQDTVHYREVNRWLTPILDDAVSERKSVLIVLNTIRSAQETYHQVKSYLAGTGYYTGFLSASVVPAEREERISLVKDMLENGEPVCLVTTQVVEAGVDLDFDIAVRDFGPVDSIVQVAGRCNRNAAKEESRPVYIVRLCDDTGRPCCSYVYDLVLLDNTQAVLQCCARNGIVSEKDYRRLVSRYYDGIGSRRSELLEEGVNRLNYSEVGRHDLIERNFYQLQVFVAVNDESEQVLEELFALEQELKNCFGNYEARMRLRQRVRELAPLVYRYVATVSLKKDRTVALPKLPFFNLFYMDNSVVGCGLRYLPDMGLTWDCSSDAIFA